MFDPKISLFKNARSNQPMPGTQTVTSVLSSIKDGTYMPVVQAIRATQLKADRDELKKKTLQAVTWSGTFSKRNAEGLTKYSFLVCQDLDNLPDHDLQTLKKQLQSCPYIYSVFTSPSGNGLKVIFRADESIHNQNDTYNDTHLRFWSATANFLDSTFAADVDQKTKDICRLCFVSYDPDLYVNDAATVDSSFIETHLPEPPQVPVPAEYTSPANLPDIKTYDWIVNKCHEIVVRTCQPEKGMYNRYINLFAIQANRYGLSQSDAGAAIARFCGWPGPDADDMAVIKSAYKKFASEHGRYLNDGKPIIPRNDRQPITAKKESAQASAGSAAIGELKVVDDSELFWYEVEKTNAQGKVVGMEYKYSYNKAINFLANNGFYRYKIDKNSYQLIRVDKQHKIVEIVDALRIKDFMIGYLVSRQDESEVWQVLEMFRRGTKNYISMAVLEGLPYYEPTLKRDTKDTGFVYFKNCFLEITAGGIAIRDYKEQQGFVWRKQIIDFNFIQTDEVSEFELYLWYAITGEKKERDQYDELQQRKFNSACSSIGYMLHQFKNPALARAVISVDKKKRSLGEPNGRSGKSLLAKGLAKMINECFIDGPNFKFEYEFAFQKANVDTQFLNFNDVPKNFPFDRLFGMITEEFTFNKKKIDSITIPFSDAPKFYISTNFSLKGDGESNKGRQQIIEFSDYFTSAHTPAIEFGHMFFYEWDDAEWCRFYNFMVGCMQKYLKEGLLEFPLENYGLNKLIDTAGEPFIDYMDYTIMEMNPLGTRLELKKLFETYKEQNKNHEKVMQNTFKKWVNMWAELHGLVINAHKATAKEPYRDKSNGIDYVTFTKKAEPVQDQQEEPATTGIDHLPF